MDVFPEQYPVMIVKRDGRVVPFESERITRAISLCFQDIGATPETPIEQLVNQALNIIAVKYAPQPTVEQVQDAVEHVLLASGEYAAAKHFILYRAEHAKQREDRPIPPEVRQAFDASKEYFPTPLQEFQFFDKYSRFDERLGRRETWAETVRRAVDFLRELAGGKLPDSVFSEMFDSILAAPTERGGAIPSMRLLAMAGPAARRNNISIYNCSYLGVDCLEAFPEALLISMAGCGVGYSVEQQYVEKLPRIKRQRGGRPKRFIVPDTTEGWAEALLMGLQTWFDGGDVAYDFSLIRPAGAVLRTKGGRASGPEPLRRMLDFVKARVLAKQGKFLTPLDAHDIMCAVGGGAVSGGHRRTAMIALFDYDDQEMRNCKSGDFWRENPQRWNANNSAVWPDRPLTQAEIMQFLIDMDRSRAGEPGIFSRRAANLTKPDRRQPGDFGCNPCGEVNLRPNQFCNLTAVICRREDTEETLRQKVRIAAIIGTIQSLATNFPGLRPIWKENCEAERLIGVDLNGQLDSPVAQDAGVQERLRQLVLDTNAEIAELLGINRAAAATSIKPSGNSSQLFNTSSGLHPRWSRYYIRNVRIAATSPLFPVLKEAGVPMSPENGQNPEDAATWVIHFPVKSPDGAITRHDRTAIQQCNYWLQVKTRYTEHNPSVTITYKPDELLDVAKWVWKNQDRIGGMTFLPSVEAHYEQMPYVEIGREEYERLAAQFPEIDFAKVYRYEADDLTTASGEVACAAGGCDLQL